MIVSFKKEVDEAILAGELSLTSLRNAKSELDSASNWGIFDILGGGFITSMVKHSKLDNATRLMEEAKRNLKYFEKELADVNRIANLNLNISGFLTFADYFFDGMIADLLVQSQISDTQKQVNDAIRQVENMLDKLNNL